jgi:hypothetical protein
MRHTAEDTRGYSLHRGKTAVTLSKHPCSRRGHPARGGVQAAFILMQATSALGPSLLQHGRSSRGASASQ